MTRGTRTISGVVSAVVLTGAMLIGTSPATTAAAQEAVASQATSLPGGGTTVFEKNRFLTAFYGTAGTSSLGVLGENPPDTAFTRIKKMGKPFVQQGEKQLPVYELIVTVADGEDNPGTDGDFSHDIPHSLVQSYIDAAHRNGALLLLDIQPGRTDFLTVAKRWEWALADPWVGLALDPEWRVSDTEFPGQSIGSASAKEINRTAGWLSRLTRANDLPEKLFVLHQFQTGMIPDIGKVRPRDGLAMVQHVDGFGSPANKVATYKNVARPRKFTMGFKIFLDEDVPRMKPRDVRRLPGVRFVSFQ